MVLKLGYFDKQIINNLRLLKFHFGEGRRKSVGPIVWKIKKYYKECKEEWNILNTVKGRKVV
jgi:hypothetical protein